MPPISIAQPHAAGVPSNSVTLTEEQAPIVSYKGKKLVIKAFAGTGKTFTLVQYALANPSERILYLAFNRAIRDEAVTKFPSNVDCKTSHQLAYAASGRQLAHKLQNNLRLKDIANAIDISVWSTVIDVRATLTTFLASADTVPGMEHFTSGKDKGKDQREPKASYRERITATAAHLWDMMIDPESDCPATHDTYLKLYQLSNPKLSARYTVILFDEGQDANEVTTAIVTKQDCSLIVVGDSHQQIYAFRGASDALDAPALTEADRLYLTNSFRFGPKVASVANALLALKHEPLPVNGLGGNDEVLEAKDFSLKKHGAPVTFLARTVMGVIHMAIYFAGRGASIHLVGGHESYDLRHLEDLYWLSKDQTDKVSDKRMLAEFPSFAEYESMAEATKDSEMLRALKLLDAYSDIPAELNKVRQQSCSSPGQAMITMTTAHRSKGLEWPTVYLINDFPDIFDPEISSSVRDQEINLLYVAATRAARLLVINEVITDAVRLAFAKQTATPGT